MGGVWGRGNADGDCRKASQLDEQRTDFVEIARVESDADPGRVACRGKHLAAAAQCKEGLVNNHMVAV